MKFGVDIKYCWCVALAYQNTIKKRNSSDCTFQVTPGTPANSNQKHVQEETSVAHFQAHLPKSPRQTKLRSYEQRWKVITHQLA